MESIIAENFVAILDPSLILLVIVIGTHGKGEDLRVRKSCILQLISQRNRSINKNFGILGHGKTKLVNAIAYIACP